MFVLRAGTEEGWLALPVRPVGNTNRGILTWS